MRRCVVEAERHRAVRRLASTPRLRPRPLLLPDPPYHPHPHPHQDDTNPDFVAEVATLYFSDTGDKLARLAAALAPGAPPCDLASVDAAAHQLKGASASFGAAAVAHACAAARLAAANGDTVGAAAGVNAAVAAFDALRVRMETYSSIDARLRAARG